MLLFYKIYRNAPSATAISIFGGALIALGVIAIFASKFSSEGVIIGIITAAAGVGLRYLADKQAERVWRKKGIH